MQGPQRIHPQARPPAPAAPADAARHERFLRQLAPSPWDEAAKAEASDLAWTEAAADLFDEEGNEGSPSHGDEGQGGGEGDEASEPAAPPSPEPSDAPPQALMPWRPENPARRHGDSGASDGSPVPATAAGASSLRNAPWLGDFVEQVTSLAAGGDVRFRHWSIDVPLDPETLPDCELRLTLSPATMSLRFRTGSARSAALVSQHRDTLRAQLEALPSLPPSIDIDLE